VIERLQVFPEGRWDGASTILTAQNEQDEPEHSGIAPEKRQPAKADEALTREGKKSETRGGEDL